MGGPQAHVNSKLLPQGIERRPIPCDERRALFGGARREWPGLIDLVWIRR